MLFRLKAILPNDGEKMHMLKEVLALVLAVTVVGHRDGDPHIEVEESTWRPIVLHRERKRSRR